MSQSRQRHLSNLDVTGFGDLSRSSLMSRVRSKGNKSTEGKMVILLRSAHITGWRRHLKLIGNPDFIWRKERLVLFVDGCFWHGHDCGRNLTPRSNANFWEEKITATRRRDLESSRALRERGWTVVRVWECQLKRDPDACLRLIRSALKR